MYCSITFKGRKDPQDPKMVKLEMVFYKTGYTRIPRVVNITGAYKHWDNDTQSFATSTSEYLRKNQLLLDLKEKYLSVAERWEKEGRNFSVLQWADCFKPKEEEQKKQEAKVLTVLQLIDARIEYFENHEKFKNGRLVKSIGTAGMYRHFRTSLSAFTQKQYNKDLSRFYFTDITQKFLLEYIVYLERRGIENGNRAGLRQLLRIFRALVNYAKDELHMYGANPSIFEAATEKMAWGQFESKAVNPNIIRRMEFLDRSLFTEQEQLCLDLFLFSFYSGGMANVDVVNLTWDMINEKEGMIVYERTKFPKLAKPLLIDRLIDILNKYRGKGVDNYVFPVYTEKHVTDRQKMGRRSSFSSLVSETLDKACGILGIEEKMTWYTARGTFISSELDAGTPITHVAEMAGNSARTIEKHYYKNTKQEELRQRMNTRYRRWGQSSI